MLLIGAGPMAVTYAGVLKALNVEFTVIGRGESSASKFEAEVGVEVICGGLEEYLEKCSVTYSKAIISTGVNQLASNARCLIDAGVRYILIEKPGALNFDELISLNEYASKKQSRIYIAYNRRFLESVQCCRKMLKADGGVKSFHFEFTEWSDAIGKIGKDPEVLKQWMFANSTHVIDLGFYIGGEPESMATFIGQLGNVEWHPEAASFSGAGITKQGATFSYCANWDAPGRWSLEFMSTNYRFIFSPMEQLKIVKRNTVTVEEVEHHYSVDKQYKPGLYDQVNSFLDARSGLMTLGAQVERLKWYSAMHSGSQNGKGL